MNAVSIIIPIYNEAKYIKALIQSLKCQDYPKDCMEVIFVDGASNDGSVDLIKEAMQGAALSYRIVNNPKRNVSMSMNMGIRASHGEIIVRLDGHTQIPNTYISMNVHYLKTTKASNVGCLIDTQSEGLLGGAIASVLSSPFGVGNSNFRIGSASGYVDTVPFGCLWRKTFDEIGLFNESLTRSEDNELNARILKHGGTIYLFDDIATIYHPRDTIASLLKMGYANGKEIIQTILTYHENFRVRYLIPLLFVLFLLVGIIVSFLSLWLRIAFLCILALYVALDIAYSFVLVASKQSRIRCGVLRFFIYPLFHICYGFGSLCGIIHYTIKK